MHSVCFFTMGLNITVKHIHKLKRGLSKACGSLHLVLFSTGAIPEDGNAAVSHSLKQPEKDRDRRAAQPRSPSSPRPRFLEAKQERSMREIRPNNYRRITSGVQWGKCLENQVHKVPLFLITAWSRSRWNSQKMTNLVKENGYNLIIYKVNSSLKRGSFFKQHLDSYSRKQARRKLQTEVTL